jgi:Domain of unknown function (DUF4193)
VSIIRPRLFPEHKDTMADDDVIDEADGFEEDLDADIDVDDLDEEALDEDGLDDDLASGDEGFVATDDADIAVEVPEEPAPRARKKASGDDEPEEDEEVVDPDDVEADLDTILKDRIAAADDEDEDEEEVEAPDPRGPETPDGVTPKKANEFVCPGCFLLVNRGQFGPADNMTCPVGESDCPAIAQLQKVKK